MSIAQKRPFAQTINDYIDNNIKYALAQQGQVLPCVVTKVIGAIVTVNFQITPNSKLTFPPVTCPIAESTYVRLPVQVGDFGICMAADARLGGISGLGTGEAADALPSNLGGLVFVPIGNQNWSAVDPNAVNINAPNGAVITTQDGSGVITVSQSQISINYGGASIVLSGGNVEITGTLIINGTPFLSHHHGGVQSGGSNTGGVTP
jgi:hypothetical protein